MAVGVDERVVGLVYVAAVAPDAGETVQDPLDKYPSISLLASRSGRAPGCFRTAPGFSPETSARKTRGSSGPPTMRLSSISHAGRDIYLPRHCKCGHPDADDPLDADNTVSM